jgi:hypothetical protein
VERPRQYKTRFETWRVRKYRTQKAARAFDHQIKKEKAQSRELGPLRRRAVQADELPDSPQELPLANRPSLSVEEDLSPCSRASSTGNLRVPSRSNYSSCHNTAVSSVIHTPDGSRETSGPSSSELASLESPESSTSSDWTHTPLFSRTESTATPRRSHRLLGNAGVAEVRVPLPLRTSQIPCSIPNIQAKLLWRNDGVLLDQIVRQVMGISSPSLFRTPNPAGPLRGLMSARFSHSSYPPEEFRQELGRMMNVDQDLDLPSPQPETWISLGFLINILLGQGDLSTAKHAMLQAAMIYQGLVRAKNDKLLSVLPLIVSNLFLYDKGELAAELLSQAKIAASMHLKDSDPIMISMSFIISMALKRTKTCGIGILDLRQASQEMRTLWGLSHRFCITSDYNLAWRLAQESVRGSIGHIAPDSGARPANV